MGAVTTAIVVAVIAAAASVWAAILSRRASDRAAEGAREIASLNHQVARLDRATDQLREDYKAFVAAAVGIDSLLGIGKMMGATEVLCANPQANDSMRESAVAIRQHVATIMIQQSGRTGAVGLPDEQFDNLQTAFRSAMADAAGRRDELLNRQLGHG